MPETTGSPVILNGDPLTTMDVIRVAREFAPVTLDDDARARMQTCRETVDRIANGTTPVYGINTGFGSLSQVRIGHEGLVELQRNIVHSHAAGVGDPLAEDVVRGMMLVLAASLARAHSGVRPDVVDRLLHLLNTRITPVVPSRGSVGASGDLAPLAHIALAITGEGEATFLGLRQPTALIDTTTSSSGLQLDAKEGLALLNGTHMMSAIGAIALEDCDRIFDAAMHATAMAIDACRASHGPLDPRLHAARNQPGQEQVAARLRAMLQGSEIVEAHREDDPRVQDPYSLRAAPQVLGAVHDAMAQVRRIIEQELGGVSDNPLVFEDGSVVSGGNFHGMPLAIALDTLRNAICHVAGIAERRVFWVLSGVDGHNPVTPYLAHDPGLHSGLMIAQYTAAALCNELQVLAHPASPGNISTSAGIEDYNSMGATAANLARQSIDLLRDVVAIELLVMSQAMEHQRPLTSGPGVEAAHAVVRSQVAPLGEDRIPATDIRTVSKLVAAGAFQGIA